MYHGPLSGNGCRELRLLCARRGKPTTKDRVPRVSDSVMAVSRFLAACTLFATLSGCAAGELNTPDAARPGRPLYKPGESLDAHLCACKECFEHGCCNDEPDAAETSGDETALGMAVNVCSRCVRRTWTARGNSACATFAPEECCEGTLQG
jgi:hypothetical protein